MYSIIIAPKGYSIYYLPVAQEVHLREDETPIAVEPVSAPDAAALPAFPDPSTFTPLEVKALKIIASPLS